MKKKKDLFYNIYILILYIIIMFFIMIVFVRAEEVKITFSDKGYIKRIIDCDTFEFVNNNNETKTIRVLEVDTFESRKNKQAQKQARLFNLDIETVVKIGQTAKQLCIEDWENKQVIIDCWKKDKYKRDLCYVYDMKKNKYSDYMIKKKVGYYVKEY